MNSLRIAALVIAAGAFATSAASAQTSVSIAGGVALPLGDVADALNTGYNASLALTAKPPLAALGIRLEGMFNSLGFKDRSTGTTAQRILGATANATLSNPSTPLRSFYLIAGVGLYNSKVIGGPPVKANNDIGFNLGLGMNLFTGVGSFVEVRYHHVPSETSTLRLVPITLGLRF
jgi:hypothetical protein